MMPPHIPTIRSDRAFTRLLALGAGEFAHVNGSLALHLRGTEKLLRRWGNRDTLCLAGLCHAIYGTDGITGALADLDARAEIAGIIGTEAEHLAYLYGACSRQAFHPRIGTSDQLLFTDRYTRSDYAISMSELCDLCELTLANGLDLARGSRRFRDRYATELIAFFKRMEGLVSDAAVAAVRVALDPEADSRATFMATSTGGNHCRDAYGGQE